jgi:hypothetical protein
MSIHAKQWKASTFATANDHALFAAVVALNEGAVVETYDRHASALGSLALLRPERFPGLPVENAAIVTSLLRLPVEALDRRESLGTLDERNCEPSTPVLYARMTSSSTR